MKEHLNGKQQRGCSDDNHGRLANTPPLQPTHDLTRNDGSEPAPNGHTTTTGIYDGMRHMKDPMNRNALQGNDTCAEQNHGDERVEHLSGGNTFTRVNRGLAGMQDTDSEQATNEDRYEPTRVYAQIMQNIQLYDQMLHMKRLPEPAIPSHHAANSALPMDDSPGHLYREIMRMKDPSGSSAATIPFGKEEAPPPVPTSSTDAATQPGALAVTGMHSHLYNENDSFSSYDSETVSNERDNHDAPALIEATLVEDEETAKMKIAQAHVVDVKRRRRRLVAIVLVSVFSVIAVIVSTVMTVNDGVVQIEESDPMAFQDAEELQLAVTAYLNNPTESAPVSRTYGFPMNTWNVSAVTDFSNLFSSYRVDATLLRTFNEPLGNWSTSQVTEMVRMFAGCVNFDQDLSSWDVSNVKNMTDAFNACRRFTGDGIEAWDTGNVESFIGMFAYADVFNADIGTWDVSSGVDFSYMFQDARSFHQDIGSWNMSVAENLGAMFWGATSFDSVLSGWDVSSVKQMSSMFRDSGFTGDISTWRVGQVDSFGLMFRDSEYNRSLCAWGPALQDRYLQDDASRAANTVGMFANTSCPRGEDPDVRADPAGPFCHDCGASEPLPPLNDVCHGATPAVFTPQVISDVPLLFYSVAGATILATVDDAIDGCTPPTPSPGVWYSVVGTGALIEAITCFGSTFDTWLSVATGDDSSSVSCGNLTCLTYGDAGCVTSAGGSAVSWESVVNETYYLHVGGAGPSDVGTFHLVVSSYTASGN